jgi:hypothetical protein
MAPVIVESRGWHRSIAAALFLLCTLPGSPGSSQETKPAPSAPPTLITANKRGVKEISLEGKVIRVLSKTPARFPRFLKGRKAIVFLSQRKAELRKLSPLREGPQREHDGGRYRFQDQQPARFIMSIPPLTPTS